MSGTGHLEGADSMTRSLRTEKRGTRILRRRIEDRVNEFRSLTMCNCHHAQGQRQRPTATAPGRWVP